MHMVQLTSAPEPLRCCKAETFLAVANTVHPRPRSSRAKAVPREVGSEQPVMTATRLEGLMDGIVCWVVVFVGVCTSRCGFSSRPSCFIYCSKPF